MASTSTIYFSDFDYSFLPHPKTGDITILRNENAVKNSIKNLLLTKFGEVLFNSSIGSGLYFKLFEPMDSITKNSMQREITTTLGNYEPRVNVTGVNIIEDKVNQGYSITIYFNLVNNSDVQRVDVFLERIR